jgi:hypothetical protein
LELGIINGKLPSDIYRVLARIDRRTANAPDNLEIIKRRLEKGNILTNNQILLGEYLVQMCDTPMEYAGTVYSEAIHHPDSIIAKLVVAVFEQYCFLSEGDKQFLKKEIVVKQLLSNFGYEFEKEFSIAPYYDQFIKNKQLAFKQIVMIDSAPDNTSDTKILIERANATADITERARLLHISADQGDSEAMYQLGCLYRDGKIK